MLTGLPGSTPSVLGFLVLAYAPPAVIVPPVVPPVPGGGGGAGGGGPGGGYRRGRPHVVRIRVPVLAVEGKEVERRWIADEGMVIMLAALLALED